MTTAADEYYRDIIEGLAIYTRSALQQDVLATITRHPAPDLGSAFNKNQIASKMWLADALLGAVGPDLGEVTILGGWFGVLAAVLLHDPRFAGLPLLIETEKSKGAERKGTIMADPLDMKNLETLRRLRGADL